jgi:hypothetical protein
VTTDPSLGRGRSLAKPGFPDDDGRADESARAVLADPGVDELRLARVLRGVRLLSCVVAVMDAMDEQGGDKDSHMAVVSMVNDRGEKGLLAFTGVDSLARWNPEARPVPAFGRDVAAAAVEDGAVAVVIDVDGPVRRVLAGAALAVLLDDLELPRVDAMVQVALAGLTADGWVDVRVEDSREDAEVDVIVRVEARSGGHPDGRSADALARQAARMLEGRPDIHRLVPGGIGILPATN